MFKAMALSILFITNTFSFNTPNSFSSGEVISATKMNQNFSAIENKINENLKVAEFNLGADITSDLTDSTYYYYSASYCYNLKSRNLNFNVAFDENSYTGVANGTTYFKNPTSSSWYEIYFVLESNLNILISNKSLGMNFHLCKSNQPGAVNLSNTCGIDNTAPYTPSFEYLNFYYDSTPGQVNQNIVTKKITTYLEQDDVLHFSIDIGGMVMDSCSSSYQLGLKAAKTKIVIKKLDI